MNTSQVGAPALKIAVGEASHQTAQLMRILRQSRSAREFLLRDFRLWTVISAREKGSGGGGRRREGHLALGTWELKITTLLQKEIEITF